MRGGTSWLQNSLFLSTSPIKELDENCESCSGEAENAGDDGRRLIFGDVVCIPDFSGQKWRPIQTAHPRTEEQGPFGNHLQHGTGGFGLLMR